MQEDDTRSTWGRLQVLRPYDRKGWYRRVTYFLRGRKGWYLEEKAWRRKADQLRVEAESLFEDARCDTAAFSAGEAQRVKEGPSVIVNGLRRWIKFSGSGDALRRMRRSLCKNESA